MALTHQRPSKHSRYISASDNAILLQHYSLYSFLYLLWAVQWVYETLWELSSASTGWNSTSSNSMLCSSAVWKVHTMFFLEMPRREKIIEVISSTLTEEIIQRVSMQSTAVVRIDAWAISGIKRRILISMYFAVHFLFNGCGFSAVNTWRILKALSATTSYWFKKTQRASVSHVTKAKFHIYSML